MKTNIREILLLIILLVIGIYFLVAGLVGAKSFLAPLSVAGLLAMILMPLSRRMENSGTGRGWASFLSVLAALLLMLGLAFLVSVQVKRIADDWPKIKEQVKPKIEQLQEWVSEQTGIDPPEQQQWLMKNLPGDQGKEKTGGSSDQSGQASGEAKGASSGGGNSQSGGSSNSGLIDSAGKMLMGFFGFIGVTLLTCVYIFFILLYRDKLQKSFLRFFPPDKKEKAYAVLVNSVALSQSYLLGRLLLIFILAGLYVLGLVVSGVQHAILISIIAAFLSLVPYIGNIVAFILVMGLGALSGGDAMTFVGIILTFSIAQFVESYILEPYIVGHKVDLNPLMTILVVVLGGAVWGVVGMIIFIPIFGIIKIVCDHVPVLRPVGYFLGEEDISSSEKEGFLKRNAKKIRDKFKSS